MNNLFRTAKRAFLTLSASLALGMLAYSLVNAIPTTSINHSQPKWPWKRIEKSPDYPVHGSAFPRNFIWSTGTSAYQVEGNCNNSTYAHWTKGELYQEPAGIGCDHEHRYKEDIDSMAKQVGTNAYRFSLEPSKVMPAPGQFNQEELDRYADMCVTMINNGIRPIIGLHHYSDPQWFMDKGGFEKAENIPFFVNYFVTVFRNLHPACLKAITQRTDLTKEQQAQLLPIYMTFNSPTSYAASGYQQGHRPPGRKGDLLAMATVIKNMLETHVQFFQKVTTEEEDPTRTACIGITHNIYPLEPHMYYNPIDHLLCYIARRIAHDCFINFFTTGKFESSIFGFFKVTHTNRLAPKSLHIIGVNHYSHGKLGLTSLKPTADPTETPTDNPNYTIAPESKYHSLVDISERLAKKLHIPIIVTETGIGTHGDGPEDHKLRTTFLQKDLYAVLAAIKAGHPIIGYSVWSFMNNYEWGVYKVKRYGLVHIDRETLDPKTGKPTLTRTLKPSAYFYRDLIKQNRENSNQR